MYTYADFLTAEECDGIVRLSENDLTPSTTTTFNSDKNFRISKTCYLEQEELPFILDINQKIANTLGVSLGYSEQIQAQKYDVGNEFKAHTDYFQLSSPSFEKHALEQGQRTWTFMIYLNDTEAGGATYFTELDLKFFPKKGWPSSGIIFILMVSLTQTLSIMVHLSKPVQNISLPNGFVIAK
jgi:prolyl 4-hydroxylase